MFTTRPDLSSEANLKIRLIAISASVLVGLGLMALKFYAYWLTQSSAILSDALESIINVAASAFALGSIILAARRPDTRHPYGHGKVEYFSAGFEGALIILAAVGIFLKAWPQIFHPQGLPKLEQGLMLLAAAALANGILGIALVRIGKDSHSLTLMADGKHLLTDVCTSVGVLAGLGLVFATGWLWLDGAVACLVGFSILFTGARLVREAASGLMDTSDPELLEEISAILASHRKSKWIDVHQLRARRSGSRVHLDFHLVLPYDFTLSEVHQEVEEMERIFKAHLGNETDILIQVEPCAEPECPICGFDPCQHRQQETKSQRLWNREVLTTDAGADKDTPGKGAEEA